MRAQSLFCVGPCALEVSWITETPADQRGRCAENKRKGRTRPEYTRTPPGRTNGDKERRTATGSEINWTIKRPTVASRGFVCNEASSSRTNGWKPVTYTTNPQHPSRRKSLLNRFLRVQTPSVGGRVCVGWPRRLEGLSLFQHAEGGSDARIPFNS